MPRILGVDIPKEKRMEASLPYLYGIGPKNARDILDKAEISYDKRAKELTDDEVAKIASIIQHEYTVEGDLRRKLSQDIKRHVEIGTYRGLRHRRGLPARGQRTKTNSRTRKGHKPQVGGKKKK
ncbi:MAG: small subunit ribosomal protein S13 [Lysobacterales bacterium]|jgi:small subunit ribosomal protein S13